MLRIPPKQELEVQDRAIIMYSLRERFFICRKSARAFCNEAEDLISASFVNASSEADRVAGSDRSQNRHRTLQPHHSKRPQSAYLPFGAPLMYDMEQRGPTTAGQVV